MNIRPKIKICCISSLEEARMAIEFGADAIGLVGPMPSGPGVIDDDVIREIAAKVSGEVDTFLLTSETGSEEVVKHHQRANTSAIQLVDRLNKGSHAEIRASLPGVKIVQVVHVVGEESVGAALEQAQTADMILLDSGNPNLEVKELGGTGRTHNWDISRKIVEHSPAPVFLAGGLNPANVADAISAVEPFGVDLCSGVRTDGDLDPWKLERFFRNLAY
ncbi:MAG: phosphoribosylanthranilate isomerase [Acidobacteriota bacterium]|nr:phosphoribosylanthranilate isomerase [Acidobacteriota bacterium]MDH3530036.1 phosphoribosylanthranilate isomerase [Acidobacteriota bacterium]